MSLLFVFFTVILIIILIARVASKTRPLAERAHSEKQTGLYTVKKIEDRNKDHLLEALIALLVHKKIVTEEEMVSSLKSILEEEKTKDESV